MGFVYTGRESHLRGCYTGSFSNKQDRGPGKSPKGKTPVTQLYTRLR